MAINPLIALQNQRATPNIQPALNQMVAGIRRGPALQERKTNMQANRLAQQQGMGQEQIARIGNAARIGEQLIPALEAGDMTQAQRILQESERIDPQMSQQGLQMLQQNPQQLRQIAQRAIDVNKRIQGQGQDLGKLGTYNPRDYTTESWAKFVQSRDPNVLKRYESQRNVDIGGVPHTFDPARGGYFQAQVGRGGQTRQVTATDVAQSEATITGAKEQAKADVEVGKKETEMMQKKQAFLPKATAAIKSGFQDTQRVVSLIDQTIPRIDALTAGFGGSIMSSVPGTDAHDVSKNIDTIKANVGFDKLQQMREESPTGGALGQVSEMELRLLNAVMANLESSQSPAQLKRNMQLLRDQIVQSWDRVRQAYIDDYGSLEGFEEMAPDFIQQGGGQQPAAQGQQGGQGEIQLSPEEEELLNSTIQEFGGGQ